MTLKTQPHDGSVTDFLDSIENEEKRNDCREIMGLMKELTGKDAVLWGPSIVGFGTYHYVYESGTEGDWFLTGFSPRKKNISIYLMDGFKNHKDLLDKIGKHRTSVSCLYINKLADLDRDVLKTLLAASIKNIRKKYS